MQYIDQTNRRRFAYVCLIAYSVSEIAGGIVPLMTVGLFPDAGGDPLAFQRKIAAMVNLMGYTRLASVVSGGIVFAAITAMIVHRVDQLQEAARSASVPEGVFE